MKQLERTEWRRGYPIKKILILCAWVLMILAGCAGILARPENIPSLAACLLALISAVLTFPRLIRYNMTTYQSLPALNRRLTKRDQEKLIEEEKFETLTDLKTGSLSLKDFAESAHWLRINGRYIPKELVILGGPKVTFNIMNRDTAPMVFFYATGDVVKIDLGVQVSAQRIRELNAYLWSRYQFFPEQTDRNKIEELSCIFAEIYEDYLKRKEPAKESEVIAELVIDGRELRQKCIESMPAYLKKVDEKALWNEGTRKKMAQWRH